MKHLFIVNPVAGGSDKSGYVREKVAEATSGRECEHEVYVTRGPMDACEKIKRDAESGEELRVYACGGDGTFNECVNGAAGFSNVAVTHYPTGTGNDFVKMFGGEKDGFRDLQKLMDGEVFAIDLIDAGGRYSVNICSVGIDARIGTSVHNYSSIPLIGKGVGGYIISTVVNVIKGVHQPMRISFEDSDLSGETTLLCACNGRFYGGAFNPMPDARPDDGIIDILIVKKISRLGFAGLVGKYAKGRYEELGDKAVHLRGKEIEIGADTEFVVNLDGEAIHTKRVHFKLVPGALRLIVPRGMSFFAGTREETEANPLKQEVSAG